MKILVISDAWAPQVNGVVRTYENLALALAKLGHQMDVLGPNDCPLHIPMPFYNDIHLGIFARGVLQKALMHGDYDCVHLATEGPMGWSGRKVCIQQGIPFTTCYHTHFPDYISGRLTGFFLPLAPILYKLILSFIRKFHAPSRTVLVVTSTLHNFLKSNGFQNTFAYMNRGINAAIFYAGKKTEFKDLPKPIALYVGRVSHEKNIAAFLNTPWSGSKVIVGSGPQFNELRTRYTDVIFMGHKSGIDLANCYRSADIFVFPSKTDTFGMVNIEALACGLPVAAYPVQGPIDIIKDDTDGALDKDLAVAMAKAMQATGSRAERAQKAAKTYDWEKVAKDFLAA